jgi:hypothetical protein
MGFSDDFQHKKGEKDGARGKMFGDITNPAYREGYSEGKFQRDKHKYGETFARLSKAERDWASKSSNQYNNNKSSGQYTSSSNGGGGGSKKKDGCGCGCLTVLIALLGATLAISGMRSCISTQFKDLETKIQTQNLENKRTNLKQWLKENKGGLIGNLDDYEIIENIDNKGGGYTVALVSTREAYIFHSLDEGKTFHAHSEADKIALERIKSKVIEMQKKEKQKQYSTNYHP